MQPKNLARQLSVNFARLTREILVALPRSRFDLDRTIARLRHQIWGDDLTFDQKQDLLFGDRGWDDLPMAVLAARHFSLPPDRLPCSREALAALCRRLLSRADDDALVDTFVRGWADEQTPLLALETFIDRLWAARGTDPVFFAAIVRGRHAAALDMIASRQLSRMLDDERAIQLLTRMSLVWAAFDCQATTARARRSMTRPMGWLVIGAAARMRVSTLICVFRPIGAVLQKVLGAYRNEKALAVSRKPRIRHAGVTDIRARGQAVADHLEAAGGAYAMDAVVDEVIGRHRRSAPFIEQVRAEQTDRAFGERQMSQVWYADLSPVQIVGLVAMRLAQLEQQLSPLIHAAVTQARHDRTSPRLFLPDFDGESLQAGWKGRSRAIGDALRGGVLRDPDHQSVRTARLQIGSDDAMEGAAHDDRFIDAVEAFFARTGRYGPVVNRLTWFERRGALEDLDVAVEQRFALPPPARC